MKKYNLKRKLNQHQRDYLKNVPYRLDGSIVYFSTWDTSDFIVFRGKKSPIEYDKDDYPRTRDVPILIIKWNRKTSEKSGIFTIVISNSVIDSCFDYINNPQSFNGDGFNLSDDELVLLIKCMKQYVEIETNTTANKIAVKKVFLDR